MSVSKFVECLIIVSEKAANLAKIIRRDEHLFALLIEKKGSDEANPRFVNDFKTLADVLIQETVKYYISKLYPSLKDKVQGEESSTFKNVLGEEITVEIFDDVDETAALLEKVLNGDTVAAKLLAEEVYRDINLEDVLDEPVPEISDSVDSENWKLWIDPIDATAEYIRGDVKDNGSIPIDGLKCVTVLIGVYDVNSGRPIIGVVNQPFHTKNESAGTYKSEIYWGVCLNNGTKLNNIQQQQSSEHIVVLSASEDRKFKKVLKDLKYKLVYSAGAGHKILKVITGEADLYLLSKNTTYKWDTCAPQAILLSSNGVLINLRESIIACSLKDVNYCDPIDEVVENKNEGGLVAIRDAQQFLQLMQSFRKN